MMLKKFFDDSLIDVEVDKWSSLVKMYGFKNIRKIEFSCADVIHSFSTLVAFWDKCS